MQKYIYVITNKLNNKQYVGQTSNPEKRFREHLWVGESTVGKDMSKFGIENFEMSVLEGPIENYDEREIYWIAKLNTEAPNGYNITRGGKGFFGKRYTTTEATLDVAREIISMLYNESYSFGYISKTFSLPYNVIKKINNGELFYDSNIDYPIRFDAFEDEYCLTLKKTTVELVCDDLKNTDMSIKDISKKYFINDKLVSKINNGTYQKYLPSDILYPIRDNSKTEQYIADKIIDDLIRGDIPKRDIAKKYGVSYSVVSGINRGQYFKKDGISYPIKKHEMKYDVNDEVVDKIILLLKTETPFYKIVDITGAPNIEFVYDVNYGKSHGRNDEKYPIRERKPRFSDELVEEVKNLLRNTGYSQTDIGKMVGMERTSVGYINRGERACYRKPGETYPIR